MLTNSYSTTLIEIHIVILEIIKLNMDVLNDKSPSTLKNFRLQVIGSYLERRLIYLYRKRSMRLITNKRRLNATCEYVPKILAET